MLSQKHLNEINETIKSINWSADISFIKQEYENTVKVIEEKIKSYVAVEKEKRTFKNTVAYLEDFITDFHQLNYIHILGQASLDPQIRKEATKFDEKVSNYLTDVVYREDVYCAFEDYVNNNYVNEKNSLSEVDNYLVSKYLLDFKRLGHGLPTEKKMRLIELTKEITKLQITYSQTLKEDKTTLLFSREELEGISPEKLQNYDTKDEKYIFTTKYPDYNLIMKYAQNFSTRKSMLQAYMNRGDGPNNTELFQKTLELREEFASILEYENYASYVQEIRMANNPKNVEMFLEDLKTRTKVIAEKELETFVKLKEEQIKNNKNAFHEADFLYYSRINEERQSGLDDDKIKEFFPMDYTLQAMMNFYQNIFHLKFIMLDRVPVWHTDVIPYAMIDQTDNSLVGVFYLDLYPREGKYGHYAAFTIKKGLKSDEKIEYPVSAMLCNFPKPTQNTPSLLTQDNVETLFHEFGHIIHQLIAKTPYRRFSGTAVARDFVETPSQILENWVWEKKILKMITSNYKSKETMPDAMIDSLINSRRINMGSHYIRQILLAIFDQHMHTKKIDNPQEYWNTLHKEIRMFDVIEGSNFVGTFDHLMGGYQASYYGYLWAEVISDDMYKTKFSQNPTSTDMGLNYRKNVLEFGGSQEEDTIVTNFLGRKFNNQAFLEKLGL